MIKSGFASREALMRLFGIHDEMLKGTSILFASYVTDGASGGEAVVLLKEVKTGKLLYVGGYHTKFNNLLLKRIGCNSVGPVYTASDLPDGTFSLKGACKGQWLPKEIDPKIALRMSICKDNFRIRNIIRKMCDPSFKKEDTVQCLKKAKQKSMFEKFLGFFSFNKEKI